MYNNTTVVKKRRREKRRSEKKKVEKALPMEAGPKLGRGLGGGWGLCLGPTGLEKALGAMWGGA